MAQPIGEYAPHGAEPITQTDNTPVDIAEARQHRHLRPVEEIDQSAEAEQSSATTVGLGSSALRGSSEDYQIPDEPSLEIIKQRAARIAQIQASRRVPGSNVKPQVRKQSSGFGDVSDKYFGHY